MTIIYDGGQCRHIFENRRRSSAAFFFILSQYAITSTLSFVLPSSSQLVPAIRHNIPSPEAQLQMSPKKKRKTSSSSSGRGFGAAKKKTPSPTPPPPTAADPTEKLLADLATSSSTSVLGRAISSTCDDPFYDLIPSLLHSRFPHASDTDLTRVAGFLKHATDPSRPLENDIVNDDYRPHEEIHAYMPGLPPTRPFHDPDSLSLCRELATSFPTILEEYRALVADESVRERFQSVTSMNYDAGWKTLVLFYNGHRIEGFPYHLCPVTTRIMESVPLAGRIAGFNRQRPRTGIPLHSDGNNMWLTCQMGVVVPEGEKAYIRVGPETRRWSEGQCLLYDTTYEHETMNESEDEERVVLHIDFFNTLAMTPLEIEIMQYIYEMREKFMKAEGVAKVGAQIL